MRQFFVTYRDFPGLSPLLRELPWSSHLHILSRSKRPEEREFYLRLATQNRWPVREVARQLDAALFERAMLSPPRLSTALRVLHPTAASHFKDAYLLEFLALPGEHEVVEYALSRTLSPALIAEYQTRLPDKKLLAAKLHEFYALNAPEQARAKPARRASKKRSKKPSSGFPE